MKRKILFATIISCIILLFSVSYTFANTGLDNVTNGIRNFVGGTENALEDAGSAITGTVRNGMNTLGNGAQNVTNDVAGAMTDDNNNDNNGDYNATQTATTRAINTDTTGTYNNMWTWVIVGITAVGIGVLIWSYMTQKRNNSYIDTHDNR